MLSIRCLMPGVISRPGRGGAGGASPAIRNR